MYENYVYGSVQLTTQTLESLQAGINNNEIIYFNYSVDVSTSPALKVGVPQELLDSVAPQYLFNPLLAAWRLHFLSSPNNVLITHPTYIEGQDSLNIEGFVWVRTNVLTD